jgi:roadblock/LC7 domain-containing protein
MEIEADKIVLAGFYGDNGKLLKFKEHLENELKEAKMEIIVIYPAVNVFEEDLNF